MTPTTRRHPRTLSEAFGPYTSQEIAEEIEPFERAERIVLWGCGIAFLVFVGFVAVGWV